MVRPRRCWKHVVSVAVVAIAVGLSAAPVSASTAQLIELEVPPECKYPGFPCHPTFYTALAYDAGPGEANRVRFELGAEGIRVTDAGAPVEPGPGCSSTDTGSVRCDVPDSGVVVATGGGDDRVRVGLDEPTAIDGGPGDDVLVGGPGRDRLYGGNGADVLRGGDESDELYDGALRRAVRGGDLHPFIYDYVYLEVAGAGQGRDSFDGGPGRDSIGYQGRRGGVRVDLATAAAVGGARGERDSVRGVESAIGSGGDDLLAGSRRGDGLSGGAGDDRIRGRQGNDGIQGGSGRNVIFAGPGHDWVNSPYQESDLGAEQTFCGRGADRVSYMFPGDFLNDDCEILDFPIQPPRPFFHGTVASFLPLDRGGSLVVLEASQLWCPAALFAPCALELSLLVDGPGIRGGTAPPQGTVLGSASYTLASNEYRTVSLSLSDAGARILRRHRVLRVRIHVDEGASQPPGGYLTILRAPR
jgi:hypothetical protein